MKSVDVLVKGPGPGPRVRGAGDECRGAEDQQHRRRDADSPQRLSAAETTKGVVMGRYLGPKLKLSRREGTDLLLKSGVTPIDAKCRADVVPGQHGTRRTRLSDYAVQLREKQKVRRFYGVLERQFRNYYRKADRQKGATGANLLLMLERRLDNVVYRMGFGCTRAESRQLVSHKSIEVNGRAVNIPSYLVNRGGCHRRAGEVPRPDAHPPGARTRRPAGPGRVGRCRHRDHDRHLQAPSGPRRAACPRSTKTSSSSSIPSNPHHEATPLARPIVACAFSQRRKPHVTGGQRISHAPAHRRRGVESHARASDPRAPGAGLRPYAGQHPASHPALVHARMRDHGSPDRRRGARIHGDRRRSGGCHRHPAEPQGHRGAPAPGRRDPHHPQSRRRRGRHGRRLPAHGGRRDRQSRPPDLHAQRERQHPHGGEGDPGPRLSPGRVHRARPTTRSSRKRHAPSAPCASTPATAPCGSVAYDVESARVEQRTDLDKLVLDIESNGTIDPEEAIRRAATILQQQLAVFVDLESHGESDGGVEGGSGRPDPAAAGGRSGADRAVGQLPQGREHLLHRRPHPAHRKRPAQDAQSRQEVADRDQGRPGIAGPRTRHAAGESGRRRACARPDAKLEARA